MAFFFYVCARRSALSLDKGIAMPLRLGTLTGSGGTFGLGYRRVYEYPDHMRV